MKVLYRTGALLVVLSTACAKTTSNEAPPSASAAPAASSAAAAVDTAPAPSASAAAGPGSLPGKDERLYRGTIDKKLAVVMRLTRNGSFLDGRYFYETQGVDLALNGALNKDGTVALKETSFESTGKKETGVFEGTFAADGAFNGTWSDPKKTKSLAFALTPVTPALGPGPVTVIKKKVQYTAKAAKPGPGADSCEIKVDYPEIVGGFDAKTEAAVNRKLRIPGSEPPAKCDEAVSVHGGFKVHMNRAGVLSVELSHSDFTGGAAHPSNAMDFVNVRIPSGDDLRLKALLKPTAKPVFAAAIEPQLAKAGLDPQTTEQLRTHLAVESADFAVEEQGLRLFAFNALPHAIQGASGEGFLAPYGAVKDTLVEGTPIAALAAKAKPAATAVDAGSAASAPPAAPVAPAVQRASTIKNPIVIPNRKNAGGL